MSQTYVVTGATGFIGRRLVACLQENGHRVIAITRGEKTLDGVDCVAGDVCNPASLDTAFQGADGVFNLAALFNDAECTREDYRAVNVDGALNVLRAAHAAGVARVVHCSTVGVATEASLPPYTEDTPYSPCPGDKYEETKAEGEQAVRKLAMALGQSLVVIRPTQVYGPGDRGKAKFYRMVRKGWIVNPAGTMKHPVYVDDLCRAMMLAMQAPGVDHEVILVAGKSAVPLLKMVRTASRMLGVPEPKNLPAWPVQMACVAVEKVFSLAGRRPPVHGRSMDFFRRSVAVQSDKAQRLLGFEEEYPLERGMQATVDWYIENDLL